MNTLYLSVAECLPYSSRKVESVYKHCHTGSPKATVSRREEELPPQMSKRNDILYFKHTQRLENGRPLPDRQSRCHCKLCSLMTPDWGTLSGKINKGELFIILTGRSLHKLPFPLHPSHRGEFTCVCGTMRSLLTSFTSTLHCSSSHKTLHHRVLQGNLRWCDFQGSCQIVSWRPLTTVEKYEIGYSFFFFLL